MLIIRAATISRYPLAYPFGYRVAHMPFTYLKRVFLNPISTQETSYVQAVAESSDNGEYKLGTYMLTIADCRRVIELEFFLGTPRHRRQSLRKINLLIDILTSFKRELEKQSKLIDEYSKK